MNSQQRLVQRYLQHTPPAMLTGQLTWIGLRPAHKQAMKAVEQATAVADLGLEGDHRMEKSPGSARQVTLISEEFIQQISTFLQQVVSPEQLRRNLLCKGLNLNALRHQRFKIGDVILEASALCQPCSRMEKSLGAGAMNAMLGHGGLCCKIIQGGDIKVGDEIQVLLEHT